MDEALLKKINQILRKKKLTISVAESCTGGLLSYALTKYPGSSEYFKSGIVAYHSQEKVKLLNISPKIIKKYSAVSKLTALKMAENIKKIAATDISLSITGFAGPKVEDRLFSKGVVFIGIASKNELKVEKRKFKGGRNTVQEKAVEEALRLLKETLKKT